MQLHKIALADTHAFSNFFIDYIEQKEQLKEFYHLFPTPEHFRQQLTEKSNSFPAQIRTALREVLTGQYKNMTPKPATKFNLELLGGAKTFTITTGHQLNVFTGPLFFIYKIVTVLNACKTLKRLYPDFDFVPVYWMASEDHDYEEIRSFTLYGKKYTWNTNQKGAVGRFNPKSLEHVLAEVPGDVSVFKEAYLKQSTLADAVRHYINGLFGDEGLIVLDGDDARLKNNFKKVIHSDLFDHLPKKSVEEKNKKLEELGYAVQVFARDINFFYLDDQLRERIERKGSEFLVVNTDLRFSEIEMSRLIDQHPEKFSPNVILRPLYQEIILPNLAYVGGPAEMIYWLQLKGVFDQFKTPFPILLPRNFALVIEQPLIQKWQKTKLEISDLFKEKNFLFNHWVLKNTQHNLTVEKEMKSWQAVLEDIRGRATTIDPTLGPLVGAEGKRAMHGLEKIERKMLKAEKRLQDDKLSQIEAVKDALFPNGKLQERTDNFLNFYQKDPSFILTLLHRIDPFDFRFNVLCYD